MISGETLHSLSFDYSLVFLCFDQMLIGETDFKKKFS